MVEHVDFGIIPFRILDRKWDVLFVQHQAGHWSFPKGHQEKGEIGEVTALRELREETGIENVSMHTAKTFLEEYVWEHEGVRNHKAVTYFLARVENQKIHIPREEIRDVKWVPVADVEKFTEFASTKKMFRQAYDYIRKNRLWT